MTTLAGLLIAHGAGGAGLRSHVRAAQPTVLRPPPQAGCDPRSPKPDASRFVARRAIGVLLTTVSACSRLSTVILSNEFVWPELLRSLQVVKFEGLL